MSYLRFLERENKGRHHMPVHTFAGLGRGSIVHMDENGVPRDGQVRARYADCPLRMVVCKDLEKEREHRLRKVILEGGFNQKNHKSRFDCFSDKDKDKESEWTWLTLSLFEKLYLANELQKAGLCKPKMWCKEFVYERLAGKYQNSPYETIHVAKDIWGDEVVVTNEEMEVMWVGEMIGDFMRVELEKPDFRHDNLRNGLLFNVLTTDELDVVVKAHDNLRDCRDEKCIEKMRNMLRKRRHEKASSDETNKKITKCVK